MRIEQFSQDLRVPRPFIHIRKQLIGDLYPLVQARQVVAVA